MADCGSLFLDEIGDISLQPKLLRAVQEREFEGLGGGNSIHVKVRMIAATRHDLAAMIHEQKFRENLYRVNVFPTEIPPLRAARIFPLSVNYFAAELAEQIGNRRETTSGN